MNSEQIANLKKIYAVSAHKNFETSPLALRLLFGLVAVAATFGGLAVIAKAAGL